MTPERRCEIHPSLEVVDGHSMPVCPAGHACETWNIVLGEDVIGHAHFLRGGYLLAGVLDALVRVDDGPPAEPCPRGHVGQWQPKSDRPGWRCGECRRIAARVAVPAGGA